MAKTNGKRNREAGHNWEQEVVRILKERGLYPNAVTARSESKGLDDMKIDIMNRDEFQNGVMRDTIQTKNTTCGVSYDALLKEMKKSGRPGRVIFHKYTALCKEPGMHLGKFVCSGKYAITELENYLELMACRRIIEAIHKDSPEVLDKYKA